MSNQIKLPLELETKVNNLSPMQRKYCEFRSRGISQSECVKMAGGTSSDYKTRADIGYQIERMDGTKDYIEFLKACRAQVLDVEAAEVIHKLREVYTASMDKEKFQYAVQSAQLLGETIGLFGKGGKAKAKETEEENDGDPEAFKGETASDKVKLLQKMMREINKGSKDEVSYNE